MKYCFYTTILLFLVIIQTVIFPYFSLFNRFYDLMLPFVIFLGMFRPFRESIAVVTLAGLLVDSLSGGYFGLYITIYIWLFLAIKWVVKFLQLQHGIILLVVSAVCVFVENVVLFGAIAFSGHEGTAGVYVLRTIAMQLVWAIITGPLIVMGLVQMHGIWVRFTENIFMKKDEYNR